MRSSRPSREGSPARKERSSWKTGEDASGRGGMGRVLVSQQDYDSDWVRIPWPPHDRVEIPCLNPNCSSPGFSWERLEITVVSALQGGSYVAGSLRCEGTDVVTMSRCSNALVYLWEDGD